MVEVKASLFSSSGSLHGADSCSKSYGPLLVIDYVSALNIQEYQNGILINGILILGTI